MEETTGTSLNLRMGKKLPDFQEGGYGPAGPDEEVGVPDGDEGRGEL